MKKLFLLLALLSSPAWAENAGNSFVCNCDSVVNRAVKGCEAPCAKLETYIWPQPEPLYTRSDIAMAEKAKERVHVKAYVEGFCDAVKYEQHAQLHENSDAAIFEGDNLTFSLNGTVFRCEKGKP